MQPSGTRTVVLFGAMTGVAESGQKLWTVVDVVVLVLVLVDVDVLVEVDVDDDVGEDRDVVGVVTIVLAYTMMFW